MEKTKEVMIKEVNQNGKKMGMSIEVSYQKLPYHLILVILRSYFLFKFKKIEQESEIEEDNNYPTTMSDFFGRFKFDRSRKVFAIFASILVENFDSLKNVPPKRIEAIIFDYSKEQTQEIPIAFLKECRNVKVLTRCGFTEEHFEVLSDNIESLHVKCNKIDDSVIEALNKKTSLTTLKMFNSDTENRILTKKLKLNLKHFQTTILPNNFSFEEISIKKMHITNSKFSEIQINQLFDMKALKLISFENCVLDNSFIKFFSSNRIKGLFFKKCKFDPKAWEYIKVPDESNLQNLFVEGQKNLPIILFIELMKLKKTETLLFSECDVSSLILANTKKGFEKNGISTQVASSDFYYLSKKDHARLQKEKLQPVIEEIKNTKKKQKEDENRKMNAIFDYHNDVKVIMDDLNNMIGKNNKT